MRKKGFTLTELLVVISIIGILSAVVMVGMKASRERAKVVKAKADVSQIGLAVTMLYSDTRMYPDYKTDLTIWPKASWGIGSGSMLEVAGTFMIDSGNAGLVNYAAGFTNWNGPYYKGSVKDPWGAPYYISYRYVPQVKSSSETQNITTSIMSVGSNNDPTNNNYGDIHGCNDIYKVLFSIDPAKLTPSAGPFTFPTCPNSYNGEVN